VKRFVASTSLEVDFPISPNDADDVDARSSIYDDCIEHAFSFFFFFFFLNWRDDSV